MEPNPMIPGFSAQEHLETPIKLVMSEKPVDKCDNKYTLHAIFELARHTPDIIFEYDNAISKGMVTIGRRTNAYEWEYKDFTEQGDPEREYCGTFQQCLHYLKSLQ